MSPDQASGRPVDYRSDQFALGLLIYELVTRRRPFDRPTTAQTLAATIEADPPPLASLRPDVPPHLAAVVRRLLAKNPDDRYESTRDLARELNSILETTSTPTASAPAVAWRGGVARVAAVVVGIAVVGGRRWPPCSGAHPATRRQRTPSARCWPYARSAVCHLPRSKAISPTA
jgi:eukaryotic-like serine/threonine-protein kinase